MGVLTTTTLVDEETQLRAGHRAQLEDLLDGHAREEIPCRSVDLHTSRAWLATEEDEQAVAAAACHPCPTIHACRAYGTAWPAEAGVYGGLTERQRRRTTP